MSLETTKTMMLYCFHLGILPENVEYTKRILRRGTSKDSQYNGKKKKDKTWYSQLHRKLEIEERKLHKNQAKSFETYYCSYYLYILLLITYYFLFYLVYFLHAIIWIPNIGVFYFMLIVQTLFSHLNCQMKNITSSSLYISEMTL